MESVFNWRSNEIRGLQKFTRNGDILTMKLCLKCLNDTDRKGDILIYKLNDEDEYIWHLMIYYKKKD